MENGAGKNSFYIGSTKTTPTDVQANGNATGQDNEPKNTQGQSPLAEVNTTADGAIIGPQNKEESQEASQSEAKPSGVASTAKKPVAKSIKTMKKHAVHSQAKKTKAAKDEDEELTDTGEGETQERSKGQASSSSNTRQTAPARIEPMEIESDEVPEPDNAERKQNRRDWLKLLARSTPHRTEEEWEKQEKEDEAKKEKAAEAKEEAAKAKAKAKGKSKSKAKAKPKARISKKAEADLAKKRFAGYRTSITSMTSTIDQFESLVEKYAKGKTSITGQYRRVGAKAILRGLYGGGPLDHLIVIFNRGNSTSTFETTRMGQLYVWPRQNRYEKVDQTLGKLANILGFPLQSWKGEERITREEKGTLQDGFQEAMEDIEQPIPKEIKEDFCKASKELDRLSVISDKKSPGRPTGTTPKNHPYAPKRRSTYREDEEEEDESTTREASERQKNGRESPKLLQGEHQATESRHSGEGRLTQGNLSRLSKTTKTARRNTVGSAVEDITVISEQLSQMLSESKRARSNANSKVLTRTSRLTEAQITQIAEWELDLPDAKSIGDVIEYYDIWARENEETIDKLQAECDVCRQQITEAEEELSHLKKGKDAERKAEIEGAMNQLKDSLAYRVGEIGGLKAESQQATVQKLQRVDHLKRMVRRPEKVAKLRGRETDGSEEEDDDQRSRVSKLSQSSRVSRADRLSEAKAKIDLFIQWRDQRGNPPAMYQIVENTYTKGKFGVCVDHPVQGPMMCIVDGKDDQGEDLIWYAGQKCTITEAIGYIELEKGGENGLSKPDTVVTQGHDKGFDNSKYTVAQLDAETRKALLDGHFGEDPMGYLDAFQNESDFTKFMSHYQNAAPTPTSHQMKKNGRLRVIIAAAWHGAVEVLIISLGKDNVLKYIQDHMETDNKGTHLFRLLQDGLFVGRHTSFVPDFMHDETVTYVDHPHALQLAAIEIYRHRDAEHHLGETNLLVVDNGTIGHKYGQDEVTPRAARNEYTINWKLRSRRWLEDNKNYAPSFWHDIAKSETLNGCSKAEKDQLYRLSKRMGKNVAHIMNVLLDANFAGDAREDDENLSDFHCSVSTVTTASERRRQFTSIGGSNFNNKQTALTEEFDCDHLIDITDYIKKGKHNTNSGKQNIPRRSSINSLPGIPEGSEGEGNSPHKDKDDAGERSGKTGYTVKHASGRGETIVKESNTPGIIIKTNQYANRGDVNGSKKDRRKRAKKRLMKEIRKATGMSPLPSDDEDSSGTESLASTISGAASINAARQVLADLEKAKKRKKAAPGTDQEKAAKRLSARVIELEKIIEESKSHFAKIGNQPKEPNLTPTDSTGTGTSSGQTPASSSNGAGPSSSGGASSSNRNPNDKPVEGKHSSENKGKRKVRITTPDEWTAEQWKEWWGKQYGENAEGDDDEDWEEEKDNLNYEYPDESDEQAEDEGEPSDEEEEEGEQEYDEEEEDYRQTPETEAPGMQKGYGFGKGKDKGKGAAKGKDGFSGEGKGDFTGKGKGKGKPNANPVPRNLAADDPGIGPNFHEDSLPNPSKPIRWMEDKGEFVIKVHQSNLIVQNKWCFNYKGVPRGDRNTRLIMIFLLKRLFSYRLPNFLAPGKRQGMKIIYPDPVPMAEYTVKSEATAKLTTLEINRYAAKCKLGGFEQLAGDYTRLIGQLTEVAAFMDYFNSTALYKQIVPLLEKIIDAAEPQSVWKTQWAACGSLQGEKKVRIFLKNMDQEVRKVQDDDYATKIIYDLMMNHMNKSLYPSNPSYTASNAELLTSWITKCFLWLSHRYFLNPHATGISCSLFQKHEARLIQQRLLWQMASPTEGYSNIEKRYFEQGIRPEGEEQDTRAAICYLFAVMKAFQETKKVPEMRLQNLPDFDLRQVIVDDLDFSITSAVVSGCPDVGGGQTENNRKKKQHRTERRKPEKDTGAADKSNDKERDKSRDRSRSRSAGTDRPKADLNTTNTLVLTKEEANNEDLLKKQFPKYAEGKWDSFWVNTKIKETHKAVVEVTASGAKIIRIFLIRPGQEPILRPEFIESGYGICLLAPFSGCPRGKKCFNVHIKLTEKWAELVYGEGLTDQCFQVYHEAALEEYPDAEEEDFDALVPCTQGEIKQILNRQPFVHKLKESIRNKLDAAGYGNYEDQVENLKKKVKAMSRSEREAIFFC